MVPTKPATIEIDMQKLDDVLRRVEANQLTEDDCQTIRTLFASYVHLTELLKDKNTSLARLRKMLFGASTEKTAAVIGHHPQDGRGKDSQSPSSQEAASPMEATAEVGVESASASATESSVKTPRKGHGRNGADAYAAAEKVVVPHESLKPGDPCPKCDQGTVYETGRPGVLVRLVGQAPIQAKIYELQKLRCNLCGIVFRAQSPEGLGAEKYDATAGSMIAVLKYGTGMPFNRLDALQDNLGIPLPASTQWEIVHAQAQQIEPVFEELIRQAAQGEVLHNDDTTVKILEFMGERAKEQVLAEEAEEDAAKKETSDRRGMFTSGIVSSEEGRQIALFFSGRKHAGENLADVLAERAKALAAPIQMCDALSRNLPGELKTIVAHCLAHGRRQFVEVAERFPEECGHVLEALSVIYRNDAIAKERNLSPEERLRFHQAESGPTMEELHAWLVRQFDQRRVEPNSSLGSAISYMLKHWERLTLFLRVAGAPLDNNVCERALKKVQAD